MADLSLIQRKSLREGWLTKSASAKSGDKLRNKWTRRWCVIMNKKLFYFKDETSNTAKGEIDLKAARIELVDPNVCGQVNCFKVQQAKQVFTYFVASTPDECAQWIFILRQAAGYKDFKQSKEEKQDLSLRNMSQAMCSFGALRVVKTESGDSMPEKCVLVLDPSKDVRLCSSGDQFLSFKVKQLVSCKTSDGPVMRLVDTDGVLQLYDCVITYRKSDGEPETLKLFVGGAEDAQAVGKAFEAIMKAQYQWLLSMVSAPVLTSGTVALSCYSVPNPVGYYTVLTRYRLLAFSNLGAVLPSWAVVLVNAKVKKDKEDEKSIIMKTGVELLKLTFDRKERCEQWFAHLGRLCNRPHVSYRSLLNKDFTERQLKQMKEQQQQESKARVEVTGAASIVASAGSTGDGDVSSDEGGGENKEGSGKEGWIGSSITSPFVGRTLLSTANDSGGSSKRGYLVSWGHAKEGACGVAQKHVDSQQRVLYPSLVSDKLDVRFISVAKGAMRGAAIVGPKSQLYMWGAGSGGELGRGNRSGSVALPALITPLLKHRVLQVSCGDTHTACVTATGSVFAWGSNKNGQLGVGQPESDGNSFSGKEDPYTVNYPTEVASFTGKDCRYVACGNEHTIALVGQKRKVYVWGKACALGLGADSEPKDENTPAPAVWKPRKHPFFVNRSVVRVDCGGDAAAVITQRGSVYVWGSNQAGQLGVGDRDPRYKPTKVLGLDDFMATFVSLSSVHMCVLARAAKKDGKFRKADGPVLFFATGAPVVTGFTDLQVALTQLEALTGSSRVYTSSSHTLVCNRNGAVFCFGNNTHGQLGNADPTDTALLQPKLAAGQRAALCGVGPSFSVVLMRGAPPNDGEVASGRPDFEVRDRSSESKMKALVAGAMGGGDLSGLMSNLAGKAHARRAPTTSNVTLEDDSVKAEIGALLSKFSLEMGEGDGGVKLGASAQSKLNTLVASVEPSVPAITATTTATGAGATNISTPSAGGAGGGGGEADLGGLSEQLSNLVSEAKKLQASAGQDATETPSPQKKKKKKKKKSNLPKGWKEAVDGEGNTYYYHKATRKTQWEKPTEED